MIPATPSPSANPAAKLPQDSSPTHLPPGTESRPWSRAFRLHRHSDYQAVYKTTRKQFSSSMSWFLAARGAAIPAGDESALPAGPRVGLTVGKVLGKAHERNRIKRRLREVVRHAIHELPDDADMILHPKRSVMTMDFGKLEAEVLRIFRQAAGQIRQADQGKQSGSPKAANRPTA